MTYEYDADGRLSEVVQAGRSTRYDRNGAGFLAAVTDPAGRTLSYTHDAAGRVLTQTLPGGRVVHFGYSYAYSPTSGRLSSITDLAGGSLAFTYDGALPTGITWAGEETGSITWTYNSYFEPTERKINGANPIAYAFNADGALTQAGDLTLAYSAATGLPTTSELLGVTNEVTFTSLGELSTYESTFQGSVLLGYDLTRDNLGRITSRTETPGAENVLWDYAYDTEGRLIEVRRGGAVVESYSYDPNGNRTTWTDGWGTGTATHGAQDRLLTAGGYTFTYTANGELLTKSQNGQTIAYQYDVNGALLGVDLPDGTSTDYGTDAAGRRIGKKVNGNLVKGYLYAGSRRSPCWMARAPWWPSCRSLAPALSSCLSCLVIDSATCQVVQRIDYDALGRITLETNPGFQLFGFAGGLYDPQTGLVRFGARAYDPAVGRWTAKDPPGFAAGDTSLYGCVVQGLNDQIDATGLALGPGGFERARGLMAQRMSEVQQAGDTQRVDSRQALPHNPPRARPPTDRDGPAAGSGSGPDLTARRSCARASLPRAACRGGAGASGCSVRGSLRDRGARALPRGRAGRR